MSDLLDELDFDVENFTPITTKVYLVKSADKSYVLKELTKHERKVYYLLKSHKVNTLSFYKEFEHENKIYHLYPYLESLSTETTAVNLLEAINELKTKTKITYDSSGLDEFRFKKVIVIMNDKFTSLELKYREVELSEIKDDNSWIILSHYHIILKAKDMVYKLGKKISRDLKEIKDLEYSLLHSYPTLEHFKDNKLISFPYSKYGYYVNDLYKVYVSIEHFDIDLKSLFDMYLIDDFSKKYFKFMVLYTYILSFDSIDFKTSGGINKYIWCTKKIAKLMTIFKEY